MKRPQYVFRPNLSDTQHRRAWALLQQMPTAKRKEFLVQSILAAEQTNRLEKSIRKVVREVHTSAASTILVNGQGYTNAFKTGVNITHTEIDLSDFDSPWFRVIVTARDGRHAWSNPYWFEDIEAQ